MKTIEDLIIETPLAEVFINGISKGLHNEYTIRNLQLAVKNGEIENTVVILFKGKIHTINSVNGKIQPNFEKDFYDLSYELAFKLMD